jgi:hypothetical protein
MRLWVCRWPAGRTFFTIVQSCRFERNSGGFRFDKLSVGMTTLVSMLRWSDGACGEAFDLLKVVDVVAGHGFYDGPEGHGAALGVGGGAVAVVL